jgi:hypothetical protein
MSPLRTAVPVVMDTPDEKPFSEVPVPTVTAPLAIDA